MKSAVRESEREKPGERRWGELLAVSHSCLGAMHGFRTKESVVEGPS